MTISKSTYVQFEECKRCCYFGVHNKEEAERPEDEDECKQIKDGNIVGGYAKQLFPGTIDVTAKNPDGSLNLSKMLKGTADAMRNDAPAIAEASFRIQDLFCSADLLVKTEGGYDLYEVKASKSVKEKYYRDAAFQTYVLRLCGVPLVHSHLLILNDDYVRHGNLDLHQLFKIVPLDQDPNFIKAFGDVGPMLNQVRTLLSQPDASALPFHERNSECKRCPFQRYCYSALPKPNIFDINALRDKAKHYGEGVVTYADVIAGKIKLNKRQKAQVDAYLTGVSPIVDVDAVNAFLAKIRFPIYHLDFESIEPVVPLSDNTKPLMQIPTQYSLHIEHADGRIDHKEFLGESLDPRREIAESLVANIPADGTVLVYNKTFESNRLKELANLFLDLKDDLLAIERNIVDLIEPFRSGAYYDAAMGGSNSIKQVLPALTGNDPSLDYHALPTVHNGAEAMDEYPKMLSADPVKKQEMRAGLLKYCELDTLAMVKVLEALRKAV